MTKIVVTGGSGRFGNELKKYDKLDNNYIFLKRIHVFEMLIREKLSILYLVYDK